MNIDQLYPVRALIPPVNRQAQRAIMQEYNRVAGELTAIEADFYAELFADNEFSYDQLYHFYLDRFEQTTKILESRKKIKVLVINDTYFHDMMYPIETPRA